MEPVQPAPQLARSPLPYITPRLHDDIDEEDEEDESDFSTGIGSEAVSQQYVALPWPATATVVSRGLSPCTSMRCGISSPMLGDQQICMSGSSLTVWSGAHVIHGGGGAAVWPQSLALSKTERMRVSQRSGASVGSKAVATFSDATPIPLTRSVVATGSVATISSTVNAAASSHCDLTPENLERLRRTDAVSEGFPVAALEVKEQAAAEVSPPVIIAISRSRGRYASGAGGERVSRAAALLKHQSLSTRQPRRSLATPSGSPAPVDALARATPVAGEQTDLSRHDDRRQGEHGGTTGHPPIKDSTSPLAGSHDTYRHPNGGIIKSVGREVNGNENPGPTSEAGVAATKSSPLSPAAAQSPLASSCASRHTRERGSSRVPVRRQHRNSERTRYHGEILELEDCTAMKVYTASFVSPKVFSPPTPAPDGAITTGPTPFGTRVPASTACGSRRTSVSASPNVCVIAESSKVSTSGGVSQAAWRIPSPAVGAGDGAVPPSGSASPQRRADEESTGVPRGASQPPLTGLVRKESQRTGAGVEGAPVGHSIHATAPRLLRQHGRRMPTSQQTHTAVFAPTSEDAGDEQQYEELTGVDQCKGVTREREAIGAGGQPSSVVTHQGDSLVPCSGATSRPPHLSTTAVGMPSTTSIFFSSATQVPMVSAAAAQTQVTPRHPQQQVRPVIILSSFGATAPPPSQAPSALAAAPSSNGTSDTHLKGIPASKLGSSRCATVAAAALIRRSPCDARMPSSEDCLPSLGSTQPPLSLRSGNSGSRLRWPLTVGSRASSADVSQGHVAKSRAKSLDSISPISMRSFQNEVSPPAVTGERNSPRDSSSRLGSRGPAASPTLEGQSRARWLSSNHAGGSGGNMTADPATDTVSTLAVASLDMAAVGRTCREESTRKQQTKAGASAAVALDTPSPTRAGAGGHENAGSPSVQAVARVRRTSSQAWWSGGGDRIKITDCGVSQHAHLTSATSTPSEENGIASRVVRGQSHHLEPLSGSTRPVPSQAAGTAGNAADAARLSMKTDASGLLQGTTPVPGVGTEDFIRGASQTTTSRASVLTDRRSTVVGFAGVVHEGSDSGVQAGDPIISPTRSGTLSCGRCAGALPSTGGVPACPPQNPGSLTKGIVERDQEAAGQTRQGLPRRSESLSRTTSDSANEPPSKGVQVLCPAQSPSGVRSAIQKGSGNAAPATHRATGGGISSGRLVHSPSLRVVGEPSGRLEKGLSGRLGRLPTPGSSPPGETVTNAACTNTSKDTSIIAGYRDQAPLSAARRKTAVAIRERAASASRTSTFSERGGNNRDGQGQREPDDHSIMLHENIVSSHNLSPQNCVGGMHVLPKRRAPPRKAPFVRRRRRTTDVSLPNGEGSEMS